MFVVTNFAVHKVIRIADEPDSDGFYRVKIDSTDSYRYTLKDRLFNTRREAESFLADKLQKLMNQALFDICFSVEAIKNISKDDKIMHQAHVDTLNNAYENLGRQIEAFKNDC